MAGNKDVPRVKNPPSGDGHHVTHRFMTATELAEREARQSAYDAMLARQQAFEDRLQVSAKKTEIARAGCVFAKSCKLPDAIIDYSNPSGVVPTDSLKDYGEIAWLGARDADDAGLLNLETISGSTVSLGIGRLALSTPTLAAPVLALEAAAAATLAGVVALFWTPSLGDSALYTEDQLRALKPLYVVVARPISGDHSYHPPPKTLPAFPDAIPVQTKGNRKRWESKKRIYEWAGDHSGEFDAKTGEQTGKAKPERRTSTK